MSVSDESASAGTVPKPSRESRKQRRSRIRARYESSEFSLREIAKLEGVSESAVMKWSMAEHWQQRKRLVAQVARKLEAQATDKAIAFAKDELAPFIEKEKAKITKRGIRIGNRGLTRIEKLWQSHTPTDAKAEADGARAAETLLRMARTSLGMTDGNATGGSLSMRILTGQATVQINQAPA